jgi:hypothetical protein
LSGSEALFTEQEPEEYDPCFESTLSDPTIKAKKSKPEKSTTSSTSMKNDDISKTQDKAAAETQQKMESEVYNPRLESQSGFKTRIVFFRFLLCEQSF